MQAFLERVYLGECCSTGRRCSTRGDPRGQLHGGFTNSTRTVEIPRGLADRCNTDVRTVVVEGEDVYVSDTTSVLRRVRQTSALIDGAEHTTAYCAGVFGRMAVNLSS